MRIIAGTARRTPLEVAEGSTTRPFLEMARGALFNSLGAAVAEAAVLDLYAGSGALGLEALSRGARSCLFVEREARAFSALRRNIEKCGMADRADAVRSDVAAATAAAADGFDLIFVDPPFPDVPEWRGGGRREGIMRDCARLLKPDGTLVFRIEEGGGAAGAPVWPGLANASDRQYGRSRICRYGHGDAPGGSGP